jgi:hypothetical protein
MATDPEARSSSNSAVLIAVVALILIIGLAFVFLNRGNSPDVVSNTIVNNPAPPTVVNPPPVATPPGNAGASGGSATAGGTASGAAENGDAASGGAGNTAS